MKFRRTWRHEVIIEADSPQEAKQIFEEIDLGQLNKEVAEGEIFYHEFVESVSFEDEEYNDVIL